MINSPITPSNFVNDPKYQNEMSKNRPQPRIRTEDKWIKDISEKGSIGVLFQLQGIESKLEELRVAERQRTVMSNRGETRRVVTKEIIGVENKNPKKIKKAKHKKKCKEHNSDSGDDQKAKQVKEVRNLKETKTSGSAVPGSPPSSRAYLRAHQLSGPPLDIGDFPPIRKLDLTNPKTVRVSVPTAKSASTVKPKRRDIDFVKANAFALDSGWYRTNLSRCTSAKDGAMDESVEGADSAIGARQLSPSEQREIVAKLTKERSFWFEELSRLPISMETLRVKARQRQIEDRISEIDIAIEMFSGRTVFVEQ